MKKEVVVFFEWFFVIEVELVQKFILEGVIGDLDIEIFWVKSIFKDLEKRKVDLNGIIESSVVFQYLVLGSEFVLEENFCVFNVGWS